MNTSPNRESYEEMFFSQAEISLTEIGEYTTPDIFGRGKIQNSKNPFFELQTSYPVVFLQNMVHKHDSSEGPVPFR